MLSKELNRDKAVLLKAKSKNLEPIIRVGKNGMTEAIIKEIINLLRKHKLIKIKFLKSFTESLVAEDKKTMALLLAEKTNSVLIDVIGGAVTLYKER